MSSNHQPPAASPEAAGDTSYLVIDTESIPDGRLLAAVKYAGEDLTPEEAVRRAQAEQVEQSWNKSDFIPVTFQIPVALCVLRVGSDFSLRKMTCLDDPAFRTEEIVRLFWTGFARYPGAKLVTFNGRGFDLPLLELAAYRYGHSARAHHLARSRYSGPIDLQEWFTNFGAIKLTGGLNVVAKMLGLPGKMDVSGEQVYDLYRAGKLREINDYCLRDTLDTYFVFLRSRVATGELRPDKEAALVRSARAVIEAKADECPGLRQYLDCWSELSGG